MSLCRENLRSDEGAEYDRIIDINLSELEPHVNGPFTPDLAHPISQVNAPGCLGYYYQQMERARALDTLQVLVCACTSMLHASTSAAILVIGLSLCAVSPANLIHTVSSAQLADAIRENGWPSQLTASLIGSCTNSSYEDMTRSASIAKQALEAGIKAKVLRPECCQTLSSVTCSATAAAAV